MVPDRALRGRPSDLADARAAIAAVTGDFVRLLREGTYEGPALGPWGVGEIACHVSHVFRVDTDSIAGRPLPVTKLNPAAVAAMNDAELAADTERDLNVLAERIEAALGEFLEVTAAPPSGQVTWLDNVRIPASAAACHLLEELLVHGWDIATATRRSWVIASAHAVLALSGGAAAVVNAAPPWAFVDSDRAREFRACFDIRFRGYERISFSFDNGLAVTGPTSDPVDAHVSVDPASALLLMLGRVSPVLLLARGKVTVWGRRPWRVLRALKVMTPP